jgi:hypothetical protein
LTKLANALHAAGKLLTCDTDHGFLDPATLAKSTADQLADMNTYTNYDAYFETIVKSGLHTAGGVDRYCLGLDPSLPPFYTDAQVTFRFNVARANAIKHVCIWEDHINEVNEHFWTELATFLNE